jgi:O-antigen/teichoic acid export membrane protein
LDIRVVIANYGWLIADRTLRLILGLVVSSKVAQYLGPDGYGAFSFLITYIAFFQAIATLGLDVGVVRRLATKNHNAGQILGTTASIRFAAGVVTAVAAVTVANEAPATVFPPVHLVLCVIPLLLLQSMETIDLWYQSQGQNKRTVKSRLIVYCASSALKILLIHIEADIWQFALLLAVEAAILGAALANSFRAANPTIRWSFNYLLGRELVAEGLPFMLAALSILVYMRIDQFFITTNFGDSELGQYAAASLIASLWHFVPATLVTSAAPYFASLHQCSREHYERALKIAFKIALVLGLISCSVTYLTADWIIALLFGQRFAAAASLLKVLVFTNFFISMGLAQNLWIITERRGKLSVYRALIGAVVSVLGNFLLLPTYGLLGVAATAVVAQACSAVLSNMVFAPSIFKMQINAVLLWK